MLTYVKRAKYRLAYSCFVTTLIYISLLHAAILSIGLMYQN